MKAPSNYPAVVHFSGRQDGAGIVGYAAPSADGRPCVIGLYSGGAPIAFARATRFSETAESKGVRLGWCGFELPGLKEALALSDAIEVRCAATDKVLMKPTARMSDLEKLGAPTRRRVSVTTFLGLAQAGDTCPDVRRLVVFAREHLNLHGPDRVIDACYLTVLGRMPSDEEREERLDQGMEDEDLEAMLDDIAAGDETETKAPKPPTVLPGPYQPGFAFDVGILGYPG